MAPRHGARPVPCTGLDAKIGQGAQAIQQLLVGEGVEGLALAGHGPESNRFVLTGRRDPATVGRYGDRDHRAFVAKQ